MIEIVRAVLMSTIGLFLNNLNRGLVSFSAVVNVDHLWHFIFSFENDQRVY